MGPGAPIHVVPDANGWYPILAAADVAHPNWLLSWPTHAYGNGLYELRLELGQISGPGINVVNTSDPRRFHVDNTDPELSFIEIRWRPASTPLSTPWTAGNSTLLPTVCPILHRPAGATIHLRVVWNASARRLRNAQLTGAGCGGGKFTFVTPVDTHQHWHVSASDNAVAQTAVLELPGTRPAGCYHVRADAWGRAFNPSGFDAGPSSNWYINQGAFSWNHVSRSISVVDV